MSDIHAVVIDDDVYSVEVLSRLLTSHGVSCTEISDARNTERVIRELSDVDVVFVDLEMPGLNGYEIFDLLKDMLAPEIPIVACTVHTNEFDTVQDVGFHSFIAKPIDSQRFPAQLGQILNDEHVWEM